MYRAKKRFTLIELLVVAGLMVLMVSLAMPAFSKMTGNNKVDVMASNIKTALEQAQSTALSRNIPVAVIFPLDNCDKSISDYAFGGYRLAEVELKGVEVDGEIKTEYYFKRWISDTYLNKTDGAALVAAVKADDSKDKSADDSGKPTKAENKLDKLIKVNDVPDGISGNCAVVFKAIGESVNVSMYLVVATAEVNAKSGSGAELKNISADDFRLLRTNQFTGRVDYVD